MVEIAVEVLLIQIIAQNVFALKEEEAAVVELQHCQVALHLVEVVTIWNGMVMCYWVMVIAMIT